jgi:6-phosphogluconolactonase
MRSIRTAVALFVTLSGLVSCNFGPSRMDVYIGTYTGGNTGSEGIYLLDLDMASGELISRGLVAKTRNPSFLAIHPGENHLFSVGEFNDFNGQPTGSVSAFQIDDVSGELSLINETSSGGGAPCHLVVDRAGRTVLAANYVGGSVCAIRIQSDGSLGEMTAFVQHEGSSVTPRQTAPHAHSINVDPSSRYALAADLGMDKVLVYRFDAISGTLEANEPPGAPVTPGGGPRHFAFHPSGRFAYVNNELTSTVTGFSYDGDIGTLAEIQTVSSLPKGFQGGNSTAQLQVHPSGRFLYVSNRGHDSVGVFQIDQKTGRLTYVENESTGGKTPRNFGIDPTGTYLLAANQSSGNVVVFHIDPVTGALSRTAHSVEVPAPVCVTFIAR